MRAWPTGRVVCAGALLALIALPWAAADREAPQAPRSISREAPQAPRSISREAPQAPRSISREAPRFTDRCRCAYQVRYQTPGAATVQVRLVLRDGVTGPRTLVVPRAVPMGYEDHAYDRFISGVRALSGDGAALPVQRQEGPRWTVGRPGVVVDHVDYEADVLRMEREVLAGVDASKVRPGYVGLLGYTMLGFIEGLEEAPVCLQVSGPQGWPVISTLDPAASGARQRWLPADDYYALADAQILMGPELRLQRLLVPAPGRSGPVPLLVALYNEGGADLPGLGPLAADALRRVMSYFGEAPFSRYTAQVEVLRPLSAEHRYGFSIEHLDSASLCLGEPATRGLRQGAAALDRDRALFNLVHHMAHAYIPKRSHGPGYRPFSWEASPVLDTIWLSEGFVQYVAIEALAMDLPPQQGQAVRAAWVERRFQRNLEELPAFLRRLSLVELSRLGSDRYAADFRIGRALFSRGGLLAAELDRRIRERTGGQRGLRDALRELFLRSADKPAQPRRPFQIEELPGLFQAATGVDTADIWKRWLGPMDSMASSVRETPR